MCIHQCQELRGVMVSLCLCDRDLAGYHNERFIKVELDGPDTAPGWKLPEPGQLRTRAPLVQLEAVCFTYPDRPPVKPAEPQPEASTSAAGIWCLTTKEMGRFFDEDPTATQWSKSIALCKLNHLPLPYCMSSLGMTIIGAGFAIHMPLCTTRECSCCM